MKRARFSGVSVLVVAVTLALAVLVPSACAYTYKVLYKFPSSGHATYSTAGLTWGPDGNLYGTTEFGGAYGYGRVYQLTQNPDGSWTEKDLYSFTNGSDGAQPWAAVTFDPVGDLYGTTAYGGLGDCSDTYGSGCGAVFQLTPNPDGTWTETTLYSFTGGTDGGSSTAGLIFDASGNLYGTAHYGGTGDCEQYGYGAKACGAVFELSPNFDGSWTETVLHSFNGPTDGLQPRCTLLFDSLGNLYGTTYGGANCNNCGTVFELSRNPDESWTENVLHKFTGGRDGQQPWAGPLIFDSQGNLYGTAEWGGFGYGTVFELTPLGDGTWTGSVLHSFTKGYDGAWPHSGVTFDAAGSLYSTTSGGGTYGYGVVFKLTRGESGKWHEYAASFKNNPASSPFADVIFDAAGNLYGVSHGTRYDMVVFEITP